ARTGGRGRAEAGLPPLVAEVGALAPARARVACMHGAAPAAACVGAVAEGAVVAGRAVVRVDAGAAAVTVVVGADVAVARARSRRGPEAVLRPLVAEVGAFASARARVAAMD